MQIILAIDSDLRQSEKLAALVRARLTVDLVQATSAGEGLHALKDRVPDLILTSPLLSPFDDGVLDEYLRDLGASATHVQTLRIPVLSAAPKKKSVAKSLFSLGRKKQKPSSTPDGCDPKVFADEIAQYLSRAAETRSGASAPAETPLYEEPEAFVEDYLSDPVESMPEPIVEPEAAYEPVYAEPAYEEPAYEEPAYEKPVYEEPVYDEPVPAHAEPMAASVGPEASDAAPEPLYSPEYSIEAPAEHESISVLKPVADHEPVYEAPEPVYEAPPAPAPVEAAPEPTATTGSSPSFEAALAAIRAAWTKPNAKQPADAPAPVTASPVDSRGPVNGHGKPRGAASAEVDLTNEVDALEDVIGVDDEAAAHEDPSTDATTDVPSLQRKVDKHKKRLEKLRGKKMRGPDGRPGPDDWGVFDPKQCGFSALVNKLDEVTDTDEVTTGASTVRTTTRVISVG